MNEHESHIFKAKIIAEALADPITNRLMREALERAKIAVHYLAPSIPQDRIDRNLEFTTFFPNVVRTGYLIARIFATTFYEIRYDEVLELPSIAKALRLPCRVDINPPYIRCVVDVQKAYTFVRLDFEARIPDDDLNLLADIGNLVTETEKRTYLQCYT